MHPMSRVTRQDKGPSMTVLAISCFAVAVFWSGYLVRGLRDLHRSTAATLAGVMG